MKLQVVSRVLVLFIFLFSSSVKAALIDMVIDVSGDIYDPEGMTWDGTYLWVVDDENDFEVHQIDPVTGDVISVFAVNPAGLPVPDTEAITWDGTHLWVMESTGVLGKYTTTGELVDTLNVIAGELDGVTWNDNTFWFTNKENGEVFQIDEEGEGIRGFSTGLTEIDSVDYYSGSL